jgi:diacylglycerol O-acyltransferase / wax synthase
MEQLSGLDAAFLYLETPSLHMHVSMAAIFDPTTVPSGYSFDKLRDLVGARLERAPIFRRRLVTVPFRLGHPYWVDDPTFDLEYHIRRAAVPAPGGIDELAQLVGDVCSRQLDRTKPLWEMYIVEGLRGGQVGLVTKIHHCTIDGVSGSELLAQLFDLEPEPPPPTLPPAPVPEDHLPSDLQLVVRSLSARAMRPFGITKLAWRTGRALLDVRRVRARGSGHAALPLTTPRTSLNAAITPHRRVAFSSIPLEDVKGLKRECGTTVNDVVLAVCTGALRRYLTGRDELPAAPLVATVPVSVAPTAENRRGANKVSAMFVSLPCHLDDPIERLQSIKESTKSAKEEHHALGAEVLLDWAEHTTPNVFSAAARAYTRLKLADRHRPIHSLVISNVPGPDFPLYLAGAELVAGFPLGPVMDGAALNITVMSYRGVLNWGLMACAETVPLVRDLARYIPEALDELLGAAGLEHAAAAGVAPGRTRRRVPARPGAQPDAAGELRRRRAPTAGRARQPTG